MPVDTDLEPYQVLHSAKVLYDASEVAVALDRLATACGKAIADRNPVILAVMNGGLFVSTELGKRFDFPYEFDSVQVSRYGSGLTGGELTWKVRPSIDLRDRVVLLVDDVLDRGVTLDALLREIGRAGVRKLYTVVLIKKVLGSPVPRPRVDFFGLESPDVFLFGCGMDYAGYWRLLPAIYQAAPP